MQSERKPTLTIDQILAMIEVALEQQGEGPIATIRRHGLSHLKEMITQNGLKLTDIQKRDSCLLPVIFQELNYDDYSFSSRTAPLGYLENIVELDVIMWSGGFGRAQLTDAEYQSYLDFFDGVLNYRSRLRR